MRLNPRELEVLKILHESARPLTSTEIVNGGVELTQSTVQAVLRKLLAAGLVDVQGVTHSGNVLSRTFGATEKSKEMVIQKFFEDYVSFRSILTNEVVLVGMAETEEDLEARKREIDHMIEVLIEYRKKMNL